MTGPDLVFWHLIQSPHQADLVAEIARISRHRVAYVFEEQMSRDRRRLGWTVPAMGDAHLFHVSSDADVEGVLRAVGPGAVHICQGLRANGLVGVAEQLLARAGEKYGVVLETLEDRGWRGVARRWLYRRTLRVQREAIRFILAIGSRTGPWLTECGGGGIPTYEFAYFLHALEDGEQLQRCDEKFSIGFVGQLIARKRVDLLLDALGMLGAAGPIRLVVVGDGPLRSSLERRVASLPRNLEVRWHGVEESTVTRRRIAAMDCLVLPSRHDGWGAVVSEALLAGVPAVCSDACGVSGVVECSRVGGVFRSGDAKSLADILSGVVSKGASPPDARSQLAAWARGCLSGTAGAEYLTEILAHADAGRGPGPVAPWRRAAP